MKVLIKRNVGSFNVGEIDVDEIRDVHWDNISGGVHRRQAGYSLYGYIDYDLACELVDCSGSHSFYHNDAKILIPSGINKKDPYSEGYEYLLSLAGKKPKSFSLQLVGRSSYTPCTVRILKVLEEGSIERKQLREKLKAEGYPVNRICGALKVMVNDGRIIEHGSPNSPHQLIEKCKNRSEILTPNDKKDFIRNIKYSESSKSIFDRNIDKLNAIRSEADRLLAQGHQARAIEFYKWFVTEYRFKCHFYKDLGDCGYSEVKVRLESLVKELKQ